MINWLRGSALVCAFAGPVLPVESWALRHANKCTPDQLIAAVFIESIARNFDDWRCGQTGTTRRSNYLENTKKKLRMEFSSHYDYSWSLEAKGCSSFLVKEVNLDEKSGREIMQAYCKIRDERKRIEQTKARIEREQKETNAKWNLAETLLGMKRNEVGALVPVDCE